MSISESFNYIEYSDQNKFTTTSNGKIQLKQYSDDIVFYVPFDVDLNAKYSAGVGTAVSSGTIAITNFGVFGQYAYFQTSGLVRYDTTNFDDTSSQGSLNFRLRAGFNNNPGYQDFFAITDPTVGDTNYHFNLFVNSTLITGDSIHVKLNPGDTMNIIKNKIYTQINPFGATPTLLTTNNIRVSGNNNGDSILIMPPVNANSMITLLGGIGTSIIPNAPLTSSDILQFYNGTNNNNRIILSHLSTGKIKLRMYNSSAVLVVDSTFDIWSNHYYQWYDFELCWNTSIVQLFVDGTLFGVTTTGFTRTGGNYLYLQSNAIDFYRFDELIVYNVYKHSDAFTVSTSALSAYPTDNPYLDIHFGTGFKSTEVSDFNLICSPGCYFVVKIGNIWYYYVAGSWQVSNATFAQSSTPDIMQTKFTSLPFVETQEIITRVFFHSDGATNIWLSELEIVTVHSTATPAIITGYVDLSSTVDLSTYFNVFISTNLGNATVDISDGAGDSLYVTFAEIKNAIANASIAGLALPTDDSNGHLVLKSSTLGDSAFVAIAGASTNDALSIIFGAAATASGYTPSVDPIDYSELFRYVRAKLGEPTLPVELTDEQLMDCLSDATFHYNRWRNFKEQLIYTNLSGGPRDGYLIPPVVGGADNILEIIVQSKYPYSFYAGRSDDIIGNLYVQSIFHKWKSAGMLSDILSDYYMVISLTDDINIILGTQIKWEIANNRIFLFPTPPTSLQIGIRYRGALSPQEIISNWWVRRLVLAEAKIVLGNIRSTFKSGIPGGTEMIQLNGEDLKAEGEKEKTDMIEEMKKSAEPLEFTWF